MPGGKRGANTWYDDDDMYDDEDYDEEDEEAYQAPVKFNQQARSVPTAAPAKVCNPAANSRFLLADFSTDSLVPGHRLTLPGSFRQSDCLAPQNAQPRVHRCSSFYIKSVGVVCQGIWRTSDLDSTASSSVQYADTVLRQAENAGEQAACRIFACQGTGQHRTAAGISSQR